MMFRNKVSYMVKILAFYILYNYDTNFYDAIKCLSTLVLKFHDPFLIIYDTYEEQKFKNQH